VHDKVPTSTKSLCRGGRWVTTTQPSKQQRKHEGDREGDDHGSSSKRWSAFSLHIMMSAAPASNNAVRPESNRVDLNRTMYYVYQ